MPIIDRPYIFHSQNHCICRRWSTEAAPHVNLGNRTPQIWIEVFRDPAAKYQADSSRSGSTTWSLDPDQQGFAFHMILWTCRVVCVKKHCDLGPSLEHHELLIQPLSWSGWLIFVEHLTYRTAVVCHQDSMRRQLLPHYCIVQAESEGMPGDAEW